MLETADIVSINKNFTGHGTVRDENALGSTLSSYHYYASVEEQLCSIFVGLVRNHPFADGNKRTAVVVLLALSELNGLEVSKTDDEIFDFVVKVATDRLSPQQAQELLWGTSLGGNPEPGEDFHEMANLRKEDTGVPYIVHIRTRAETPGHPHTPSLKVYSGRPFSSDSFAVSIGEAPEVVAGGDGKFCKSVSAKEMKKIQEWVAKNSGKLLDFYNNGMGWMVSDISDWAKTLEKV
jgi:death-on-curing family protein